MAELLSPAGSWDALKAAVNAGADAVYLGAGSLNARISAQSFSADDLPDAVEYCHLRGVKVHVALNTLVYDRELDDALALADAAGSAGADALIVADLGLARMLTERYDNVCLHASTQLAAHNLAGVEQLRRVGFSRVVLARELIFERIKYICAHTDVEIETFIHGAMCTSVSGACLMSSFIGRRSGNRGRCAQPCRLTFDIDGVSGTHLSMKDLCGLPFVRRLADAGVACLKIEGRLKSPDYVGTVTSVYRRALDERALSDRELAELTERLTGAFCRGGPSVGYLDGSNDVTYQARPGEAKITQSTPFTVREWPDVAMEADIYPGRPARLTVTGCGAAYTAVGDTPQPANGRPLDEETVARQLRKIGDAPFRLARVTVDTAGAFLPVSAINAMRRAGLMGFCAAIVQARRAGWNKRTAPPFDYGLTEVSPVPRLIAQTDSPDIARAALNAGADDVYLDYSDDLTSIDMDKSSGQRVFLRLPLFMAEESVFDRALSLAPDGFVVQNVGAEAMCARRRVLAVGDHLLYAFNVPSTYALKDMGLDCATLSCELNKGAAAYIANRTALPLQAIVHGRVPVMTLAHCPRRRTKNACKTCTGEFVMSDKKGAFLCRRVKAVGCQIEVLNSVPTVTANMFSSLPTLSGCRVLLYGLDANDSARTLSIYRRCIEGGSPIDEEMSFLTRDGHTAGHWQRGAL